MKDLESSSVLISQNKEIKNGILIIHSSGEKQASDLTKELLYEITNSNTVVFLSGGKTPGYLYSELTVERKLKIGAAAMVDERYGKPWHANSNELMIKRSGLLDYFAQARIPFYPVLKEESTLENTASSYDSTVLHLLAHFSQSVAILGIGEDGHIAGIAPNRVDFINPLFSEERQNLLVSYFSDHKPMLTDGRGMPPHGFGERITMTFKGLSQIDALVILAFGEKKRAALSRLFEEGPLEQIPARIIKNKDIARKTVLITDFTNPFH